MFRVIKALGMGLVVGQGRFGYQGYGVPEGGPMNALCMARMNAALGQTSEAAGLELTGHFKLQAHEAFGCLCGPAAAQVLVNGLSVHAGQLLNIQPGDLLEILPPGQGLWTQIAFLGGLHVDPVLGSRGLCMAGGFGGGSHRLIKPGDEFEVLSPQSHQKVPSIALPALASTEEFISILAIQGPEYELLQNEVGSLPADWQLNTNSNRMGYRFDPSHSVNHSINLGNSYACTAGLVQMPPNGQVVILMADAQVSGGYPRYASVLHSELWKVSLLQPGQRIQFDWVSFSEACQYNKKAEREWLRFEQAIEAFKG